MALADGQQAVCLTAHLSGFPKPALRLQPSTKGLQIYSYNASQHHARIKRPSPRAIAHFKWAYCAFCLFCACVCVYSESWAWDLCWRRSWVNVSMTSQSYSRVSSETREHLEGLSQPSRFHHSIIPPQLTAASHRQWAQAVLIRVSATPASTL